MLKSQSRLTRNVCLAALVVCAGSLALAPPTATAEKPGYLTGLKVKVVDGNAVSYETYTAVTGSEAYQKLQFRCWIDYPVVENDQGHVHGTCYVSKRYEMWAPGALVDAVPVRLVPVPNHPGMYDFDLALWQVLKNANNGAMPNRDYLIAVAPEPLHSGGPSTISNWVRVKFRALVAAQFDPSLQHLSKLLIKPLGAPGPRRSTLSVKPLGSSFQRRK